MVRFNFVNAGFCVLNHLPSGCLLILLDIDVLLAFQNFVVLLGWLRLPTQLACMLAYLLGVFTMFYVSTNSRIVIYLLTPRSLALLLSVPS